MSLKSKIKKEAFSIPNIMSYFRLALIPVFIWLYCCRQDYYFAFGIIVLSGITDVADGQVARKFDMVTDLGKLIDPVADKLTQAAIIISLTIHFKLMFALILLFAAKELYVLFLGLKNYREQGEVESARWFGKLNTVLLYGLMCVLILAPTIPVWIANIMIGINAFFIILSWVMYSRFYREIKETSNKTAEAFAEESDSSSIDDSDAQI